MPPNRETRLGADTIMPADPIKASLSGRPADAVPGQEWTMALTLPRAMSLVVRLQPLFPRHLPMAGKHIGAGAVSVPGRIATLGG